MWLSRYKINNRWLTEKCRKARCTHIEIKHGSHQIDWWFSWKLTQRHQIQRTILFKEPASHSFDALLSNV